ncbi:MAG: hypothetical protein DWQ18_05435 [Crenarchaeota archaeon]|nr:MAG: hypothetical protein DWQ17_07700 [Thermoproteota archaeon]RDJ33631.1 MAG: hypothetical protein DWQ18_05435 [Thermoproteota archaeon]RDJ36087.1 MAG: hypothetical protein DWQ13_08595 [Thermoproteota archaeon]RDJ38187.1 MAG: hypothetical protein DWQ19_01740 [Thermoproteota archaeon]
MQLSDEKIREILELKDRISGQIEKHEEEIEYLKKNLSVLDSLIKQTSFTKASSLRSTTEESPKVTIKKEDETIPLTRGADGAVIANAYVTPEQVSIILDEKLVIDADTPPFKTFFLDRIIGEMKRKDSVEAESGKIQPESIIDYVINKNGSNIREIIIKNYRQKERVKEIVNTAAWSLTRMLENKSK